MEYVASLYDGYEYPSWATDPDQLVEPEGVLLESAFGGESVVKEVVSVHYEPVDRSNSYSLWETYSPREIVRIPPKE